MHCGEREEWLRARALQRLLEALEAELKNGLEIGVSVELIPLAQIPRKVGEADGSLGLKQLAHSSSALCYTNLSLSWLERRFCRNECAEPVLYECCKDYERFFIFFKGLKIGYKSLFQKKDTK